MICNFVIICFDIILQSISEAVNIFPVPICYAIAETIYAQRPDNQYYKVN